MEIDEFLLARIAEDEAVARAVHSPGSWEPRRADLTGNHPDASDVARSGGDDEYGADWVTLDGDGMGSVDWDDAAHIARWDPARVLAECDAKRRIVEPWTSTWTDDLSGSCSRRDEGNWRYGIHADAHDAVLRLLALPYADHPDYDAGWRP